MLRAGRIARRRANPLVVLADQLFVAEVLVRRIAPVDLAHPLMQIFGKGFRQAVGNRLHHNLVVIIVLRFVGVGQRVFLKAAGHRKGADIIRFS